MQYLPYVLFLAWLVVSIACSKLGVLGDNPTLAVKVGWIALMATDTVCSIGMIVVAWIGWHWLIALVLTFAGLITSALSIVSLIAEATLLGKERIRE